MGFSTFWSRAGMTMVRDSIGAASAAASATGMAEREGPVRRAARGLGRLVTRVADVDGRSLVLVRLALALLVLVEAARHGLARFLPPPTEVRPFSLDAPVPVAPPAGGTATEALLLVAAALAGVLLFVGWRTRLAAAMAWFMLAGLATWDAGPPHPTGAVLRLLLLWCVLLPVGARFSVDRAVRGTDRASHWTDRLAGFGFLIQIAVLTLLGPTLLRLDPVAAAAAEPLTLTGWTVLGLAWLPANFATAVDVAAIAGLVALLIPVGTAVFRTLAAGAMVALHVFIGVSVIADPLPLVLAAMWLAIVPRGAWNAFFRSLRSPERLKVTLWHAGWRPPLQYRLIHAFLLLPETPMRSTREDVEVDLFRRQRNSWIVSDEQGYRHLRFRAVAEVVRASPLLWPLAPVLRFGPVESLGDALFDLWQRGEAGPPPATPADPPPEQRPRWRPTILVPLGAAALLAVQAWLLWSSAGQRAAAALHDLLHAALFG